MASDLFLGSESQKHECFGVDDENAIIVDADPEPERMQNRPKD